MTRRYPKYFKTNTQGYVPRVVVPGLSATDESKFFSSASFSGTSGTLSGGIAGTTTPATIYGYTIAGSNGASGYDANGNLLSCNDGNTGGWALTCDNVNRISTGIANSGVWTNLNLGWTRD